MPHRIIDEEDKIVYGGTRPHEYELPQGTRLEVVSVERKPMGSREPIHQLTTHKIVFCETLHKEQLEAKAKAEAEERAAAIAELTANCQALTVKQLREQVKEINEARPETIWVASKAKKAVLVTAVVDCLVGLADAGLTRVSKGKLVVISLEEEAKMKEILSRGVE